MQTLLVIQTALVAEKRRLNLAGITRAAGEIGWRVQVIDTTPTQRQFEKLVAFWRPVGIIIEGSGGRLPYRLPTDIPTVLLDADPTSQDRATCVRNDSAFIGELVAKELLSLGFGHFAFVGWHRRIYWCEEKLEAFSRILGLHGAALSEFRPTIREANDQIRLQKRLRSWLRSLPLPCGVFAINDTLAEQILAAALAEDIEVPAQLAVIGVDNDEAICERTRPTLTSVMPNFEETGYQAVKTLLADRPCSRRICPLALVRRQSTRLLPVNDQQVAAALELIRREACGGLRARDVFALFPCSRRLAEQRFLQIAGTTVLKAIHRTRLERAKQLLADPQIPIKTVANRCGWNSDVIFRRIYKSVYGTPPRADGQPVR